MTTTPAETGSAPKQGLPGWAQAAAVFLIALAGALYAHFVPDIVDTPDGSGLHATSVGLAGVDGYYHIRAAYLYRTGEIPAAGADFHWTRESIWNGGFSDKDYLFHVYLIPFTLFARDASDTTGLILGAKLATALMCALLILTLFIVMGRLGVRHAWVFALGLTAVGTSYIAFRCALCRSFLFSVTFSMIGWLLMVQGRGRALLFVSALFTLSYTASHLLLAMLALRTASGLLVGPGPDGSRLGELRANGKLCLWILGGIALGVMLHPQPLELVKLWWVQNVIVLALAHPDSIGALVAPLTSVELRPEALIELGRELRSPSAREMLLGTPVIFFAPIVLPLLAALLGTKPRRETLLTSALALAFVVMFVMSVRFIEYAAPFMALAVGLWVTDLLSGPGFRQWREKPRLKWAREWLPTTAAALFLAASTVIWVASARAYRVPNAGEIADAGRRLHQTPSTHGKVVWHDRWDDFTKLFFYAPECDYLVGLDPTFFHARDAERYKLWADIRAGKHREFLHFIRDDFGASLIFANSSTNDFFYNRLNEYAHAGRLELLARGPGDAWSLYRIIH